MCNVLSVRTLKYAWTYVYVRDPKPVCDTKAFRFQAVGDNSVWGLVNRAGRSKARTHRSGSVSEIKNEQRKDQVSHSTVEKKQKNKG